MNKSEIETCQTAREFGTLFNDEFLRWRFSEGLYTPFQVLTDAALLIIALTSIGLIVWYWIFILKSLT